MNTRYEEFNGTIVQIYKSLLKIKDREMKLMEMKAAHVDIMAMLSLNPNGLTASELVDLCHLDKGAVSRAIKDLRERGLVENLKETDKRIYGNKISLTEKGKSHAKKVNHKIDSVVDIASASLSEKERNKFYKVLKEISMNLNKIAKEGE